MFPPTLVVTYKYVNEVYYQCSATTPRPPLGPYVIKFPCSRVHCLRLFTDPIFANFDNSVRTILSYEFAHIEEALVPLGDTKRLRYAPSVNWRSSIECKCSIGQHINRANDTFTLRAHASCSLWGPTRVTAVSQPLNVGASDLL